MKIRHSLSFATALLSVVFFTTASNTLSAQDSENPVTGQAPTATSPGSTNSPFPEAAQRDENDNCVDGAPSVAGNAADRDTDLADQTSTLGTDARIDPDRINCLDEHRDAPHEDNFRQVNPNATTPSERTDIIIDENLRNQGSGN